MTCPSSNISDAIIPQPAPVVCGNPSCPYANRETPITSPSPEEAIELAKKINSFLKDNTPLSSDCCLKRNTSCLSCHPNSCVHSGGNSPLVEFCHCWTCCFGEPSPNEMEALSRYFKEMSITHGTLCTSLSILKANISIAKIAKQHCQLSEEDKHTIAAKCSEKIIDRRFEITYSLIKLTNSLTASGLQEQHLSLILDIWKSTPAKINPETALNIWIVDKSNNISPFCFQRLEAFLNKAYFVHAHRKREELLAAGETHKMTLHAMFTLAAALASPHKQTIFHKEVINNDCSIYKCSYLFLHKLLVMILTARGLRFQQIYSRKETVSFSQRDNQQIKEASDTFRKTLLGEFSYRKHNRVGISDDLDRSKLTPESSRRTKIRDFFNSRITAGQAPWSMSLLQAINTPKASDSNRGSIDQEQPGTSASASKSKKGATSTKHKKSTPATKRQHGENAVEENTQTPASNQPPKKRWKNWMNT
ncbi:hypothetical protein CP10139811_0418 [Chlamydia ibidis]|uniref:Uncharacterized protein n=2 Tax=Chlamydia ibidis TaxID=1405396 RepID=S7J3J8_9CHLA|nr:hypothetical protein [Chlamydia ibidis]EPP34602.1 hypothetical protein CP10139811_0418 [Chlamydia ibidis]EQM62301.1 hypothetical protein H359_0794 [Chlamydia ibidis 10-1398/6]